MKQRGARALKSKINPEPLMETTNLTLHGLFNAVKRGSYNRFHIYVEHADTDFPITRDFFAAKLHTLKEEHGRNHSVDVRIDGQRNVTVLDFNC